MTTPDPIAAVTTGSTTPGVARSSGDGHNHEAMAIGTVYREARASMVEGVRYLIEAGVRLKAKRDGLDHGQWLPWLADNADALGFGERTAQLLIRNASNPKLASDLSEERALQVSRGIWGHQHRLAKPKQRDDDLPPDYEGSAEPERDHDDPEAGEPVKGVYDKKGKTPRSIVNRELIEAKREIAGLREHVAELEAAREQVAVPERRAEPVVVTTPSLGQRGEAVLIEVDSIADAMQRRSGTMTDADRFSERLMAKAAAIAELAQRIGKGAHS